MATPRYYVEALVKLPEVEYCRGEATPAIGDLEEALP
jgi:hypothetical protein